jgi:hypothetical protein
MRDKIFRLLFIVFLANGIFAPMFGQDMCQTPVNTTNLAYNIFNSSNFGNSSYAPKILRVYFHVIRRTDGSGGYLQYEVKQAFDILNSDFGGSGITFSWDGCIDYIDNDSYHNSSTSSSIYGVNTHTDGIDIYLFPKTHPSAGGRANGVGSNAQFWVAGSWNGDAVALTHIISHEMGHVLFLWHTHHGTFPEGGNDSPCKEFVDGTNASFCGDYVIDTPADPHIQFNVNANCQWLGSGQDAHGDPYNPDEHDIMAYTDPDCMQYFTQGQFQRMHQAILSLPYLTACLVNTSSAQVYCNCPAKDLVFSQNTTIDQDLTVTGDIRIINGATLTVKSKIKFKDGKGIDQFQNCKLIVDGGTLTSCDPLWRGIRVTGGNTDFDVKFTNNATIENTATAAVSMFAPYPWPQVQQYGNGILLADHTTFNNTRRIVEFMSWKPLLNPSYIKSCTQNGGKWSITNWNCQGIEISDNKFFGVTGDCIVTETGSFTIINNEFHSTNNDILFNNVSAGIASIIKENKFYGSNNGYNARGTTLAQNQIFKNIFQTGFLDVINDGHNSYDLRENEIRAIFGSASFGNGFGIADVHNNDFSGNMAGIIPIGSNIDYSFFKNCFSTSLFDSYIEGQISAVIADENNNAAKNCFTHQGNINSSVGDIGGFPEAFTYYEPNDAIVNCKDAIKAPLNVTKQPAPNGTDDPCGINGVGIPINTFNPCFPSKTITSALQAYNWLVSKINELQNNTTLSTQVKAQLIAIYQRCLRRVKGILFEIYIKDGAYPTARALYNGDSSDGAKINVYSSYIHEGNLSAARTNLNSISAATESMTDFKTIQNINLDRLPYGPYYVASNGEKNTVRNIALKSHPNAAYAKALYYALTEEVISSQLPEALRNQSGPRSRIEDINSVIVYPNPFHNLLNLQLQGMREAEVNIYDIFGKKVYSKIQDSDLLSISTDTWQKGLFIVIVKDQYNRVFTNKVMLID